MDAAPIGSNIDAVTVYRRGARVLRVADLCRAEDGFPAQVRVTGLPLGIEDSSVKARVIGDDAPVAADLRVTLEIPAGDESLAPADDLDVHQARRQENKALAWSRQLERELARLGELSLVERPDGADGEPPKESPIDARLAMLQLRSDREAALRDQIRAARAAHREAVRAREHAEETDLRASTARQAHEHELRKSVLVSLRGGSASTARLEIEYWVPGARWAPAYTIRFDQGMKGAELSVRAVIGQRTGEDWRGVALTLSTASATQWAELPELHSLRLGKAQRRPPKAGWRPPPTGVDELYRDYDRAFAGHTFDADPLSELETEEIYEDSGVDYSRYDEDDTVSTPGASAERDRRQRELEIRAEPQMPPMQAMPAPAMAPMARGRSKSGGILDAIGGMVTRATTASHSSAGDAPEPMMRSLRLSADTIAEPEPEPVTTTPTHLLAYGDLRMPPARSGRRGKLGQVEPREQYLSLLVHQHIEVSFDVITVIEAAVQSASSMDSAPLPHGHLADWSGDHDYAYRASDRVDVPSDGDFHSLPLAGSTAEVALLYVTVPRESSDVFRTAAVRNPLDSPLLAGPADVYVGDEFFLTSAVGFTAARGNIDLGLGVEQSIKVARNSTFREETTGLLGGGLELEHRISVDIRNQLDRAVDVEVRDRVPVTREGDDDIEVVIGASRPPWQAWDPFPDRASSAKLRGGHRWRVSVEPGAEAQLRANYTVKLSSKLELAGGNRREG